MAENETKDAAPEAPATKTIRTYGVELTLPNRYAEGQPMTAIEAAALNSVIAENVANNFRKNVAKVKEQYNEQLDGGIPEGKDLGDVISAAHKKELQAAFTKMESEYKLGAVRIGGGRKLDPVEKLARKLAEDRIKAHYYEQELKLKDEVKQEDGTTITVAKLVKANGATHYEENSEYYLGEAKAEITRLEAAAKKAAGIKVNV